MLFARLQPLKPFPLPNTIHIHEDLSTQNTKHTKRVPNPNLLHRNFVMEGQEGSHAQHHDDT